MKHPIYAACLKENDIPLFCPVAQMTQERTKKKIVITKQFFRKIVMNTTSNEDFRAVFFLSYRARSTFHAQMFFPFLRFSFFYFAYCPDVYVL